ncbi:hypothetical protein EDC04DRAFT_2604560 [Pisolithus marmoratus]|nr:hypothetical protein EDC04DRAFT_2604560 [Pisolithus marmoratus]
MGHKWHEATQKPFKTMPKQTNKHQLSARYHSYSHELHEHNTVIPHEQNGIRALNYPDIEPRIEGECWGNIANMTYQIRIPQVAPFVEPPLLCMKSITKKVVLATNMESVSREDGALFLKDPFLPLDSQDDLLPQDALGCFIYNPTSIPSASASVESNNEPPRHRGKYNWKNDGWFEKVMGRGNQSSATDEILNIYKTPWWFGNGLMNTQQVKSVSPLQLANNTLGLAKHWILR